jgi:hypothetical protein
VLKCYESESNLLKVGWPLVRVSSTNQAVSSSLAFEQKLGASSLSVNAQIDGYAENNSGISNLQQIELWSFLQARYYFLQKRRIRTHGGSHNLSGLYGAASLISTLQNTKYGNRNSYDRNLEWGPTVGFQQKLFNRGYLDYHFTFSNAFIRDNNSTLDDTRLFLRSSFKLGFAF